MANWRERHRVRLRYERLARAGRFIVYGLLALGFICAFRSIAHATWKPQYADAPQAVQDWYKNAELTPEAKKRFNFTSCCAHSDVVKTQFHVDKKNGGDQWWWLDGGEWKLVPPDIIHWGEAAPDGQPTLFALGGTLPTCFYPGASGN